MPSATRLANNNKAAVALAGVEVVEVLVVVEVLAAVEVLAGVVVDLVVAVEAVAN